MKQFLRAVFVLTLILSAGFLSGCATSQADLQAMAKVSKDEATKIALAKVPNGAVKESGLEKENGKLVWSFDIATPGTKDITEVQVDAITGAVVSVANETPAEQAKEAQEKLKEKK